MYTWDSNSCHQPRRISVRCRGLILVLGECADAHLPPAHLAECSEALAQVPVIQFTLAVMRQAGIQQVMIGATPERVAALHRLLDGGGEYGVQVSYLLLDGDSSVDHALYRAHRFIADSALLLAAAGVFCTGFELSHTWLKSGSSVASFRMRSGRLDEDESRPELLLLSNSALTKLRRQSADSGNRPTDVDQLRRSCMSRLKYSDISLAGQCICFNFSESDKLDTAIISEAEILTLLQAEDG